MDAQNFYWAFLVESKYKLESAEYAFRQAVKKARYIKIFLALVSSGAIASWAIWQSLAFVWGILIAAGHVGAAIYEYTPFQERVFRLSHMSSELERLFLEVEKGWLDIATASLTEKEIYELQSRLAQEWNNIEDRYAFYDYVTIPPSIATEINDETNQYFANRYGVTA